MSQILNVKIPDGRGWTASVSTTNQTKEEHHG